MTADSLGVVLLCRPAVFVACHLPLAGCYAAARTVSYAVAALPSLLVALLPVSPGDFLFRDVASHQYNRRAATSRHPPSATQTITLEPRTSDLIGASLHVQHSTDRAGNS